MLLYRNVRSSDDRMSLFHRYIIIHLGSKIITLKERAILPAAGEPQCLQRNRLLTLVADKTCHSGGRLVGPK
jgi:hypothetical protein